MSLDTILADVDATLEVVIELDSVKRSDGTAKTWYYSTHTRETGAAETPANTAMPGYLLAGAVGPLNQSLAEDALFAGLASIDPGAVTVTQKAADSDQLSQLNDYTFAGRQVRLKIGKRTDTYANFVTYRTATCDTEPAVELAPEGLRATWKLASAKGRLLAEPILNKRYVGIPHCLKMLTSSGYISRAHNSVYDLTSFTLMGRFQIPTAGITGSAQADLMRKFNSATDANWQVNLFHASHASAHKLRARLTVGGTLMTIGPTTQTYNDGAWHSWVFAVAGSQTMYLLVDGVVVGTTALTGNPDVQTITLYMGGGVVGNDFSGGLHNDLRIYNRYVSADEARGLSAVRCDGDDLGIVALWRCDDNSGGTANDYSSNNLDGTIVGTINTDYAWKPSDLGEPELAGRPYPMNAGLVFNAQAHLIDGNRERYRYNVDAGVGYFVSGTEYLFAARSQGTVLTGGGTDYTPQTGDGVIQMTAQEAEPVTFDLSANLAGLPDAGEGLFFPARVASDFLTGRTRLAAADVNPTAGYSGGGSRLDSLTILCPWFCGWHSDQDATGQQFLEELLGKSGLCYYEGADGKLNFDMLLPPVAYGPFGEPVVDFNGGNAGLAFGAITAATSSLTAGCFYKPMLLDQTGTDWGSSEENNGSVMLVSNSGGTAGLYHQVVGANAGKLCFLTGGTRVYSPAGLLDFGSWYFVAVVFDDSANTVKFYVANLGSTLAQSGPNGTNASAPTSWSTFNVGGHGVGYTWGSIQHAWLWNTTKTLAQLQILMATPPLGNEANLVGYAALNEGADNPTNKVGGGSATMPSTARWAPKLVANLNQTPSAKLTGFRHVAPAAEVAVYFARNWMPMEDGDIDAAVSQNNRLDLRRQWKDVLLSNADNRDRFKSSRKIILESAITDRESAQRLARFLMNRFGTDRFVGDLELPSGLVLSRQACGLTIGDELGLVGSIPSQIATARSFRVAGVAHNPLTLSTGLALWG
jgi:hypothetical protein